MRDLKVAEASDDKKVLLDESCLSEKPLKQRWPSHVKSVFKLPVEGKNEEDKLKEESDDMYAIEPVSGGSRVTDTRAEEEL